MRPDPQHVRQLNGPPDTFDRANCTPAAVAMDLDAFTRGMIRTTPERIRAAQLDQSGGIGLDDAAVALWGAWRVAFLYGRPSWATLLSRLEHGDGFVLQLTYARLAGYRAPGSTFAGGHALYVARLGPEGTARVFDPLRATGPASIPLDLLRDGYEADGGYRAGWCDGAYPGLPPARLGARPLAAAGWAELTGPVHTYRNDAPAPVAERVAVPAGVVDATGRAEWIGAPRWVARASGGRWWLAPIIARSGPLRGRYVPGRAGVVHVHPAED